jgi:hypothetical protein
MCALVCPRARTLAPFRDLGRSGAGHVQRLGLKKNHATFRAIRLPRNRLILASVDSIRSDRGSHQFASSLVRVSCTPPHLRRSGRRIFEPLADDPFAPGLTTPAGPTEREM